MIFVTLGSQKFQFDRLLIELDRLVEKEVLTEPIFAQIGYSTYQPQQYEYQKFLDHQVFNQKLNQCDLLITHGGSGAIVNALKMKKKVIAVPRLVKFNEHVDNHQEEIVDLFKNLNYIEAVYDIQNLGPAVSKTVMESFEYFQSNSEAVIDEIEAFIIKNRRVAP